MLLRWQFVNIGGFSYFNHSYCLHANYINYYLGNIYAPPSIFSLRLKASTFKITAVPAFHNLSQLYARPGFLLRRAHQISTAVFEDECKSLALTPAQFGVLSVLHASPGLDQSSLGRALGFDKVTVMRVMRGLETRGLIVRVYAPTNRRNLSISLSEAGLALLTKTKAPAEHAYDRLMSPLSHEQREQLVSLLQLLTTGLEGDARAAFVPHTQSKLVDSPVSTVQKHSDGAETSRTYLDI